MERVATCACQRLSVSTTGEPTAVMACHCDHCLRRTGSAYPLAAWFDRDQVLAIEGDSTVFNGEVVNGDRGDFGIATDYHFCPTCGSTVYWTFADVPETAFPTEFVARMNHTVVVAAGCFVDPEFPAPAMHSHVELQPTWLTPHLDPA